MKRRVFHAPATADWSVPLGEVWVVAVMFSDDGVSQLRRANAKEVADRVIGCDPHPVPSDPARHSQILSNNRIDALPVTSLSPLGIPLWESW